MQLNSVDEIIQDIRLGKMVVLMDDEDRENEGDLVMAAECVTAEHINFMAKYARGLICMPISQAHSQRLGLRLMVDRNGSGFGTKFTTSIEAASGVTTGISAADRARTVQVAAARNATASDIVLPGHIFPLIADPGGVLIRAGHTEAACDLSRLAGFGETGVICEVMNDNGSMARRQDLERFAQTHGLKIGTIADLIHYRVMNESTLDHVSTQSVQNDHGEFILHSFQDRINGDVHLALVKGRIDPNQPILVRVQMGLSVRDLLGIQAAGANGWNVTRSMARIAREGTGVLVLLGGRESASRVLDSVQSLNQKALATPTGATGSSSVFLNVGVGSQILRMLGVRKLRQMNAPIKYSAISGFDLEIVEYIKPDELDIKMW